ncbi:hypothetical protein D7Y61_11595 [Stenotrophomonas maltophilia]|nr:hypothetical protein [Stenotrophomonas maltophilia]
MPAAGRHTPANKKPRLGGVFCFKLTVARYWIAFLWASPAPGRRLIAGQIDSHIHVIRGGPSYNMELRWEGVPTLADAMAMLRRQV